VATAEDHDGNTPVDERADDLPEAVLAQLQFAVGDFDVSGVERGQRGGQGHRGEGGAQFARTVRRALAALVAAYPLVAAEADERGVPRPRAAGVGVGVGGGADRVVPAQVLVPGAVVPAVPAFWGHVRGEFDRGDSTHRESAPSVIGMRTPRSCATEAACS
jgi:hypothetical protein